MKIIRDHGQSRKYYHDVEGYNGRLDTIQAGILRIKLAHLENWNQRRRQCAAEYGRILASLSDKIVLPIEHAWSRAVYHLYVIRHPDRQGLQSHMAGQGIGTAIHYPIPLHLQDAYRQLGYKKGDFPVSESAAPQILSLPMYPTLSVDQQQRVADAASDFACSVEQVGAVV